VGDFVELAPHEPLRPGQPVYLVEARFCGMCLGIVQIADGRCYERLRRRVEDPDRWDLVGGRAYAQVTSLSWPKRPAAVLRVFYVGRKRAKPRRKAEPAERPDVYAYEYRDESGKGFSYEFDFGAARR
jgi:hypothetical protein